MSTPSPFLRSLWFWCLAGLLADGLTKWGANSWLSPGEWVSGAVPGWGLLLAYNPNGAFGWLPQDPTLHSAWRVGSGIVCLAVLAAVGAYLRRRRVTTPASGWGLLGAGGLGNLLEQALTGLATDFLVLNGDAELVRVFNVADVCLALGAVLVGAGMVSHAVRHRRTLNADCARST